MSQLPLITLRKHDVRSFILRNIPDHPRDIARHTAERFALSRVAIVNHLQRLIKDGLVDATGRTKARVYTLRNIVDASMTIRLTPSTAEDREWRHNVAPLMFDLPSNVVDICHHGFTEMFNNAIEHSGSQTAKVHVVRNALTTQLMVSDEGVGIFNKLQRHFGLDDPRHALLELCKGKLTTDPETHTGEGVFFTSRMFDLYSIISGTLIFLRSREHQRDWLDEVGERVGAPVDGTFIQMNVQNDSTLTPQEVFERFAPGSDEYGFTKTLVPVHLAQYEGEKLISRSQARRLVARFDRFVEVMLDFTGITEIGPAFADEIFRVYQNEHPSVNIYPYNCNEAVLQMVQRARDSVAGYAHEARPAG